MKTIIMKKQIVQITPLAKWIKVGGVGGFEGRRKPKRVHGTMATFVFKYVFSLTCEFIRVHIPGAFIIHTPPSVEVKKWVNDIQ